MNTVLLNTVNLDDGRIIKKGGGGVTIKNQTKSVTIAENGNTVVSYDSGYTGLEKVSVKVAIPNEEKTVDITDNGTTEVVAANGFLSKVIVNTNVTSGGGGDVVSIPRKAVNFIDCDGTTLHSYTKEEFLALSQLPELPTRQGLVCQEWNWSLEDAQAQVAKCGICDIGATYTTDDGKTRLYIKIATKGRMDVPLYFSQTVANGVTIDWGDGSAPQTLSGTGNVNTTHTYADVGEYTISLNPVDGCALGLGHGTSSACVLGTMVVYCNMLKAVEIGNGDVAISQYAFKNYYSLKSISIPNTIRSVGSYTFQDSLLSSAVIPKSINAIGLGMFSNCKSLSSISLPKGVTSISTNAFNSCFSLSRIAIPTSVSILGASAFSDAIINSLVIPDGVERLNETFNGCKALASVIMPESITTIGTYAFGSCESLTNLVISKNVKNINDMAFYSCRGMSFYDFSQCTSVPALGGTYAFNAIPSDCKVVVPDALYDSWIAATNWSKIASNIVKASEFNA